MSSRRISRNARFFSELPLRRSYQRLARILTAGDRLPETRPIGTLKQQDLQIGRVHDD